MSLNEFMRVPFDEGIADLYGRNPIFEPNWIELSRRYSREQVFGLARSMDQATTEIINLAMAKHLKEGKPREEFLQWFLKRKNIRQNTRAYAQTVYRTNLSTAYTSGRTRQAKRMRGFVVGFEFQATGDSDTRINHQIAHRLRAPIDSPFWDFFHPPLGYNCRCTLKPITAPEARRNGWLDVAGTELRTFHPRFGFGVTLAQLVGVGARPDLPTFGRMPR